mmetsp:Transcript_41149/g.116669  ORF Transcript_41149/g.116669 Transcript_41149/m.116669 type:complete len:112 (+) Transcript_41149:104-439(+)
MRASLRACKDAQSMLLLFLPTDVGTGPAETATFVRHFGGPPMIALTGSSDDGSLSSYITRERAPLSTRTQLLQIIQSQFRQIIALSPERTCSLHVRHCPLSPLGSVHHSRA